MEEQYIELINREIDGLNNPSESERLRKLLSSDDEARKYYEDLSQISGTLKRMEEVQPPASLKSRILNSAILNTVGSRPRVGLFANLADNFRHCPLTRYSLVFASGLCVGILFFVLANPWHQEIASDSSKLSGSTILLPEPALLPMIDSAQIQGEGTSGTFKTFNSGETVMVEIDVHSVERVRVELNSDPAELTFGGIKNLTESECSVSVTQGKIVLADVESDRTVVAFSGRGDVRRALEGRIYKGNSLIQSVLIRPR